MSGGLIEETYPSTRKVKYTLDNNGDLSQVLSKKTSNHGYWAYADSFAYDKNGNMTRMQLGNGLWETFEYSADRLQIKKIGLGETSTVQDVLKLEYKYDTGETSYDNNGSLREQKITVPGIEDPFIQTYTYDDLNRLASATETNDSVQTWKQTFTIDRYGNRKFNTSGGNTTTLGSCPAAECNPEASTTRNRFSTGDGYEYDENGSLIENAKGERFTYDMENHQTEFFGETNASGTPDATYQYDGDGRRVKKIVGSEVTVFVYNAGGTLVAEYSTEIEGVETARVSYLTQDHLGSPRVVTGRDGAVLSRKDYSAFGEELVADEHRSESEEYGGGEVRKGYTGYEKDGESGLEFAQARYYNTIHGRFTSVDPLTASASIRNPQTFNRYSYVLNSPYKYTDPLGLLSVTTGACGSWCSNVWLETGRGGGALTSGGIERPFAEEFEAMALFRDIGTALASLETYGSGSQLEVQVIRAGLKSILENGTQEARRIAADIVNSNIQINVVDNLGSSGATFLRDAAGLAAAIAEAGTLSVSRALGFFGIRLDRQTTLTNYEDLEATLVHEGKHASILAAVAVSLSTGNPKTYQDESMSSNEVRASTTATRYLIKRGGTYLTKGQALGFINADGTLNTAAMNAKGQAAGAFYAGLGISSVQEWLNHLGVTW